jgi:diphosphoinositol-polyphosphate diphosphatase
MVGAVSVSSASTSDSPTSPVTSPLVSRTGRDRQRYVPNHAQGGGDKIRLVAGCIPLRRAPDVEGGYEVLMVTNKHNDSLIFPKGGWETDETAAEAAARETMEEAGVRGDTSPLGDFAFDSKMKDGKKTPCVCSVFVMNVTEEMEVWPESNARKRRWCAPPAAVAACKHQWMRDALREWGNSVDLEL